MTITMTGKTVGENIRLARIKAGVSQGELAEALLVSEAMVCMYEKDARQVGELKLKKIAEVCGVDVKELYA